MKKTVLYGLFEWDEAKNESNIQRHGIDFADAVSVFSDDLAVTVNDDRFDEEGHRALRQAREGIDQVLPKADGMRRGEA